MATKRNYDDSANPPLMIADVEPRHMETTTTDRAISSYPFSEKNAYLAPKYRNRGGVNAGDMGGTWENYFPG